MAKVSVTIEGDAVKNADGSVTVENAHVVVRNESTPDSPAEPIGPSHPTGEAPGSPTHKPAPGPAPHR